MALVVLLKGVNVGGHRTFRPSLLAKELARWDVANVGAAGTFVVRKKIPRLKLRKEVMRRLPFATDVIICDGNAVLRLAAGDPFGNHAGGRDIVPFVSVLARRRPAPSPLPLTLPPNGEWGLKILSQQGQFVCGVYRRQMKAVGYLGQLEKIFGVPVTTRNWNTVQTIARIIAS